MKDQYSIGGRIRRAWRVLVEPRPTSRETDPWMYVEMLETRRQQILEVLVGFDGRPWTMAEAHRTKPYKAALYAELAILDAKITELTDGAEIEVAGVAG